MMRRCRRSRRRFAAVQPGLVELARLGSTDFAALTATERVDALIALERQRAWLDGVQQQLLAEVVRHDDPKHYGREEVSAALGLSLQTTQSRMKDANGCVPGCPAPSMRSWPGRSVACRPARSPKPPTSLMMTCCPSMRRGC
jgi:hypothetical protein